MKLSSTASLLALSAMAMAGFGTAPLGFGQSFHTPVRERDSRSDEENARRLKAAEDKRARRAAKAKQSNDRSANPSSHR